MIVYKLIMIGLHFELYKNCQILEDIKGLEEEIIWLFFFYIMLE